MYRGYVGTGPGRNCLGRPAGSSLTPHPVRGVGWQTGRPMGRMPRQLCVNCPACSAVQHKGLPERTLSACLCLHCPQTPPPNAPKSHHIHTQAKAKIMVVRDIEREDIEFISKTLGCLPIAHIDHMRPEKLGSAELVEEVDVSHCP